MQFNRFYFPLPVRRTGYRSGLGLNPLIYRNIIFIHCNCIFCPKCIIGPLSAGDQIVGAD